MYVLGAINMSNYEDTIIKVATKGGATEKGIEFLDMNNIENIIEGAINEAYNRMN